MTKSIIIVGVGGQGTLLASRILGQVAQNAGYDVKVSEVHGMSQRGGSVVTYVRYGEKVHSPIIEEGGADILVSFEQLETMRWLPYLKKDGIVISSRQRIDPMPVITGSAEYPAEILKSISTTGISVQCCDALCLAEQAGNVKAVNVVLIGLLAKHSAIAKELFIEALSQTVKEKFLAMNLKAFELGYQAG